MIKKRKEKHDPVFQKIFGISENNCGNATGITLYENIGGIVKNYRRVTEFNDTVLKISSELGEIIFHGEEFELNGTQTGDLCITGKISELIFKYKNLRDHNE